MPAPPPPPDDDARCAAVRSHRVTGGGLADADLEVLTRLAAGVARSAGAAVNLVDGDHQVVLAGAGSRRQVIPRDVSPCAHVVAEDRAIHVADASLDARFADSPLVTGPGHLRMYASSPVRDEDGYVLGTICVWDTEARDLDAGQLSALDDLATQAMSLLSLRRQSQELRTAVAALELVAATDPLTSLANRRSLEVALQVAVAADGRGATVVFVDLDAFKAVNDAHGHAAGDHVLATVAARLRGVVRPGDTVARFGGDEFVVLTTGMDPDAAGALGHRLRTATDGPVALPGGTVTVQVVVSVGWAVARPGDDVRRVLRRADGAMYRDKRERRAPRA